MSNLLSRWMERFPIILWIGAAILGRVGGEMMISDPWVHALLTPSKWVEYAVQVFFVVFVCGLSKWMLYRRKSLGSIARGAADGTALLS
jgi:predicted tellurium resistance membrane protein TerC